MNIPRAEFPLRTEAVCMFKRINIPEEQLLFLDDVDLQRLYNLGNLNVLLVDHNRLASHQKFLEPAVHRIIDHHVDENQCSRASGSENRTIEMVGSCATLVANNLLNISEQKQQPEEQPQPSIDPSLAELLLGTILVDTVNCDPSKGRTTNADIKAVEVLSSVPLHSPNLSKDALFETLREAKFSLASLTIDELLRKDYKEDLACSTPFGISSVGMSLWEMAKRDCEREPLKGSVDTQKDDLITKAVYSFMERKGLSLLVIMSTFYEGESFQRQLAFIHKDDAALTEKISSLCSSNSSANLQMVPLAPLQSPVAADLSTIKDQKTKGLPSPFLSFSQNNSAASRKVVLPLVQGIVSGL